MAAYPEATYNTASVSATRLLKDQRIQRFLGLLRDEALARVAKDLRPWRELVVDAQATLLAVMRGELRSRLMLEAAREVLDRALGKPTQTLAHEVLWDQRRVTQALHALANRTATDES